MQFFSFPLLTPTYVKLKTTVSLKPMSLPGWLGGGFGLGGVGGGGDGLCDGGSWDGGGDDGGRGRGRGGRGDEVGGGGRLIGPSFCMVLSGQSRLAELHFWLYRLCWNDRVVSAAESVMDFEMTEKVLYNDMLR